MRRDYAEAGLWFAVLMLMAYWIYLAWGIVHV